MARHDNSVIVTPYQESIAEYWNNEKSPINSLLGSLDNLYHHHYGLGDIGDGFFSGNKSEDEIIKELHRLESAQAIFLLKHLGPLLKNDHILDAGSGRGGTSFMAYDQFECYVTGISISEKQVEFSQAKATQRNIQEKVSFHLRNMLDNGFPDSFFQAVLNNESTMYVNLDKLFSEHARVLKTGGRFVCITGCYDDSNYGLPSRSVSKINSHYICNIHSHSEYISALSNNNFEIKEDMDLTKMAIPYWELRKTTALATGIEAAFLEAYKSGGLQYRLLAADRV